MAIALIDYGAGNLTSVRKGFAAAGVELSTPSSPLDLTHAGGIVVPGVGHFAATGRLTEDWTEAIRQRVEAGVPLLGICLGMQLLFDGSAEAPETRGLGLLQGVCARLSARRPLKVPHVGWNTLDVARAGGILEGIAPGTSVYFTHSYAAPVVNETMATTTHGSRFSAVVQRDHVAGIQFHPEKSGPAGIQILRNFVALVNG